MNRTRLAQLPTPIESAQSLSKEWGVDLKIKRDDLTGAELTGNKIRKLEFLLADARENECDTVITCGAVTSNHARATAIAARKQGFGCHLVLAGDPPQYPVGNLQLGLLTGAKVHYVTRQQYSSQIETILDELAQELRSDGLKPYVIPTGGSNATGLWGYAEAVKEMKTQCDEMDWQPDIVACSVGSGGTYAGLFLGNILYGLKARCLGILVCGSNTYFTQKVTADLDEAISTANLEVNYQKDDIHFVQDYIAGGYAKTDSSQLQLIRHAAQTEALILDPVYTGKAFYGLYQEIKTGKIAAGSKVLFIHTGGIFGLPDFSRITMEEWNSNEQWEDRFLP